MQSHAPWVVRLFILLVAASFVAGAPRASSRFGRGYGKLAPRSKPIVPARAPIETVDCSTERDLRQLVGRGEWHLARQAVAGHAAALACMERATALHPEDEASWLGLARVFAAAGVAINAEAAFRQALAVSGGTSAPAHIGIGYLALQGGRHAEAEASYAAAVAGAASKHAESWFHLGLARTYQHDYSGAAVAYRGALDLSPEHEASAANLGAVLFGLSDFVGAAAHLRVVASRRLDHGETWANLGAALFKAELHTEASSALAHALMLSPGDDALHARLLMARQRACLWGPPGGELGTLWRQDVSRAITTAVIALSSSTPPGLHPFTAMSLPTSPSLARAIAAAQATSVLDAAQAAAAGSGGPALSPLRRGGDHSSRHARGCRTAPHPCRLRVGYLSADVREHPVGYTLGSLLAHHTRGGRVDATVYALNPENGSRQRDAVKAAAGTGRFVDLHPLSAIDAARRIRSDGMDILISLGGFTQSARNEILAHAPAPITIQALGYAGTLGDSRLARYTVADRVVAPPGEARRYAEKLLWLPRWYHAAGHRDLSGDGRDDTTETSATIRSRLGLPAKHEGFIFCCFNAIYKVEPDVFGAWLRILARVPGSSLWLQHDITRQAAPNLRAAAAASGIAPGRLFFTDWLSLEDNVVGKRECDLFLDTATYNAHLTHADAQWAGIPVLTMPRAKWASRVGASAVLASGLAAVEPRLVATTWAEYVDAAVGLAVAPPTVHTRLKAVVRAAARGDPHAATLATEYTAARGCVNVTTGHGWAAAAHDPAQSAPLGSLFDLKQWTTDWETALLAAWEIEAAGLGTQHIKIAAWTPLN